MHDLQSKRVAEQVHKTKRLQSKVCQEMWMFLSSIEFLLSRLQTFIYQRYGFTISSCMSVILIPHFTHSHFLPSRYPVGWGSVSGGEAPEEDEECWRFEEVWTWSPCVAGCRQVRQHVFTVFCSDSQYLAILKGPHQSIFDLSTLAEISPSSTNVKNSTMCSL